MAAEYEKLGVQVQVCVAQYCRYESLMPQTQTEWLVNGVEIGVVEVPPKRRCF